MTDYTSILLLITTCFVNYITIYRKSWLFGDLIFLVLGATTYFILNTEQQPWGLLIIMIAIADLIANIFIIKR